MQHRDILENERQGEGNTTECASCQGACGQPNDATEVRSTAGVRGQTCGNDVAIAGVLEARPHLTGIHKTLWGHETFYVASSAADCKGRFGCQVWISAKASFHDGKQARPEAHNIHILSAATRSLIVRLSLAHLKVLIIVAHGPHDSGDGLQGAEDFWNEIASACSKWRKPNDRVILLTDANAQLRAGGARQELQAESFRRAIEQMHLRELTTVAASQHLGQEIISYVGKGSASQLDYIAACSRTGVVKASARAIADFASAADCLDHVPVTVVVIFRQDEE